MYRLLTLALCLSCFAFADADRSLLIFASGGYTSCDNGGPTGIGMYDHVLSTIQKGQQKSYANFHYIINCLTDAPPPSGQGQYISDEDPSSRKYADADELLELILSKVDRNPDLEIVLAGHSYGGWLVMYFAENLAGKAKIAGLYTIDPISPKTCGPWGVISGAAGCHQAPKDRDNQLILENTQQWFNFYQNQDSWLTSSEIPDANDNFHIEYRGPHTQIDSDDRVWSRIQASVFR